MATFTTAPTTGTSSALAITTQTKTFYRTIVKTGTDDEGNPIPKVEILNEKAGKTAEETLKYEGKDVLSIEHQDFVEYFSNNRAGAEELIPDPEEFNAMFCRGISTKQDNRARQWLKQTDKDGNFVNAVTEDAYDMKEDLKTVTSRRLSPEEKILDSVSDASLETMEKIEAIFAARRAALAAAAQQA